MRPVSPVVDGLPSEGTLSSFPGPISVFEMSMLRALDPVQTWLGQELEKCGIDAVIYSRYVLSLLLHDSCDYDLQEQENDIFASWEKGACKKWRKGKRKCSDITMEEMKKQAAVQCLLSASDKSAGIVKLVDELCSKLKDLEENERDQLTQSKGDLIKKKDGSPSPTRKDQAEMYYEAFPPLSEKPIYLQEIMTVWNKSKISSHSSSSTTPQSMETSPQKNCYSESDDITSVKNGATVQGKGQEMKCESEKENEFSNGAVDDKTCQLKSVRHKSIDYNHVRSWSSGSSEAGSSGSGNQSEMKTRSIKLRHKVRQDRNKKEKTDLKVPSKNDKEKNMAATGAAGSAKPVFKRAKRYEKECAYKGMDNEDVLKEKRSKPKVKDLPSWYTEPVVPHKSKLKTKYKKNGNLSNTSDDLEDLSESENNVHQNKIIHKAYLPVGTFINGHFVQEQMPAAVTETRKHTGTSNSSLLEDNYLDDVHPVEPTHFYEVEIDQSMLDPGASIKTKGESRILNMIRQKSNQANDIEVESCKELNNRELQGESAIWAEYTSSIGADYRLQSQCWEPRSLSSSADADGESLGGDSPSTFSPSFNSTKLKTCLHTDQDVFFDSKNIYSSTDVQSCNFMYALPKEVFNEKGKAESAYCLNGFGKTQSQLHRWTKNSAFEVEQCSNISTRTCSPWSNSEGTRSDTEALNSHPEDIYIPSVTVTFQDEIPGLMSQNSYINGAPGEEPALVLGNSSRLEGSYGIKLEPKNVSETPDDDPFDGFSIWVLQACRQVLGTDKEDDHLLPLNLNVLRCGGVANHQDSFKTVKRSQYHLWDTRKNPVEKAFFSCKSSNICDKDYMTPSKSWDPINGTQNSFIVGGVFGGFSGDDVWAMEPQNSVKTDLLDCDNSSVVTVASANVLMIYENNVTPRRHHLWRPFASNRAKSSSKGFFSLHENLHGTRDNFSVEKPGKSNSVSSMELSKRYAKVLHVDCSYNSGNIVSSPTCKPKVLRSEGDICPRICDVDITECGSIRISPRTHFRPITPVVESESDFESGKEEVVRTVSEAEVGKEPKAELMPREEATKKESKVYGMSEIKSGKLIPRRQKSGMEKNAQALDGQGESSAVLPQKKSEDPLDFMDIEKSASVVVVNSENSCEMSENKTAEENPNTECNLSSEGELEQGSILDIPGLSDVKIPMRQKVRVPVISDSSCDPLPTDVKEENCVDPTDGKDDPCAGWPPLRGRK